MHRWRKSSTCIYSRDQALTAVQYVLLKPEAKNCTGRGRKSIAIGGWKQALPHTWRMEMRLWRLYGLTKPGSQYYGEDFHRVLTFSFSSAFNSTTLPSATFSIFWRSWLPDNLFEGLKLLVSDDLNDPRVTGEADLDLGLKGLKATLLYSLEMGVEWLLSSGWSISSLNSCSSLFSNPSIILQYVRKKIPRCICVTIWDWLTFTLACVPQCQLYP